MAKSSATEQQQKPDLGGAADLLKDKEWAMKERMQRGRDLLNGPRGQNTAHRMQHIYRALNPDIEYSFEPTPMKPRDFPALTPAQRLHLEVNGYVVIENVLTQEECSALKADMYMIEDTYRRTGDLPDGMDPNHYSWFTATEPDFFRIDNLPHLTKSFYDYVTHPRLLAIMEEITGVEVRLEQCDAHIRRPVPDAEPKPAGEPLRYGLHGGLRGYIGRAFEHTDKGLYHYSFVKTLTNLSDLGPEDGGTLCIAGSHKIDPVVDTQDIINAAYEDPSLIHHVVAPAGSTMIFFESTIHASGIIQSGKDRPLIISGFSPANMGTWMGYQPDPIFLQRCPAEVKALFSGENLYMAQVKSRRLGEAVGEQSDQLRKEAEDKAKAEAAASESKSS